MSAPDVGTDFAADSNSLSQGMFSSGAVKTSIGSALTDFGRDDVIDAEQRLIGNKAMGSDLVWVLTNVMAAQARKTRVGGADSPIYL